MSNISITYNWSVPDVFEVNFTWKIKALPPPPTVPTIITSGPQNAINRPTLVYPNGGEDILTREIEISWKEPQPPSTDQLDIWYEVFFTENYDYFSEPDWKMIASVPFGIKKYLWKVGNSIKSKNVRVGVRAVNSRGERSDMSISSASFSIRKSLPVTPSVLSPVSGQRYGSSVKFVFDDSAIINSFSQRAKYFIYFSSAKAEVPFTSIAQNVPVGTGNLIWDTSMLPQSDDYIITVYLVDDDGNKSQEINIRDVSIVHEGLFLIDTKPPSGYIQINNSDQYTKDRNVSVRLYAFDETTGVHSMQFFENSDIEGPPDSFSNVKFWKLTEEDGEKIIEAIFQDYGANRTSENKKSFRLLFDNNSDVIADMVVQNDSKQTVWVGMNGAKSSIYKYNPNGSFITNVEKKIISLAMLGSVLYIGVETSDSTALIYRWTGFVVEEAIKLSEAESEVVSMYAFKNKLFFGSQNGRLYSYDENSAILIRQFSYPISKIYSDNSLLYVMLRNSKSVFVYDGLNFTEVVV